MKATSKACLASGRPFRVVEPGELPGATMAWLKLVIYLESPNVAGDRESGQPGVGERSERWLAALFRRIAAGG